MSAVAVLELGPEQLGHQVVGGMVGPPVKDELRARSPRSALGEHTGEVLAELDQRDELTRDP